MSITRPRRPVERATAAPREERPGAAPVVMVAITSFATASEVIREGDRLSADHPLVRRFGRHFLPDGATSAEAGAARAALMAEAPRRVVRPRDMPPRLQRRCVQAVRDRSARDRVVTIAVGTILRAGDPWVRRYPDRFEPVVRPPEPRPGPSREAVGRAVERAVEEFAYTGFLPGPGERAR